MPELENKSKLQKIFLFLTAFIIMQVTWWVYLFIHSTHPTVRQKIMFVSESSFFVGLTLYGLHVLYRTLKKERQTLQSQRTFIQTFSHGAKTPLTALSLRLQSLPKSDEIEACEKEVKRLTSLFEKTNQLYLLQNGKLHVEEFNLSELLKNLLRRLEPWFQKTKTQIDLRVQPQLNTKADLNLLQASLQAIIENAVIYNSNNEKNIRISSSQKGNKIYLQIQDNGPGISSADRQHIFEKFYRGNHSKNIPGTGLGLHLSKSIINAHNGDLRLMGTELCGTCFEISLPSVEAGHG